MDERAVLYQPGPVARVIMNRPERKNAQSARMLVDLLQAFDAAARDPEVRVIVLSGAGAHFSSGHDLGSSEHTETWKERSAGLDRLGRNALRNDLYIASHLRLRSLEKPTVAMVRGYCVHFGIKVPDEELEREVAKAVAEARAELRAERDEAARQA